MRKKLEIGDLSENCIVINYAIWILVTKLFLYLFDRVYDYVSKYD